MKSTVQRTGVGLLARHTYTQAPPYECPSSCPTYQTISCRSWVYSCHVFILSWLNLDHVMREGLTAPLPRLSRAAESTLLLLDRRDPVGALIRCLPPQASAYYVFGLPTTGSRCPAHNGEALQPLVRQDRPGSITSQGSYATCSAKGAGDVMAWSPFSCHEILTYVLWAARAPEHCLSMDDGRATMIAHARLFLRLVVVEGMACR